MARDNYFIQGERIYFREVRLTDVGDTYYRWMNDIEVTCYLESRFFPNSIEHLREYVANKQNDKNNIFLAIVLKENDRHIGNIKLGPIDWIHRTGDIGLIIGDKSCWGKGYATESIKLMVKYGFDILNLHKITAGCYSCNQGSAKAFQKAGFDIEGLRKQQFYYNKSYVDLIMLGIINIG